MHVKDLGEVSDAEWLEVVDRCDGNPLHLPAVHAAYGDAAASLRLVLHDGDTVAGCALGLVKRKGRLRRLLKGPRVLELPSAPATTSGVDLPDAYAALASYARGEGLTQLVVRPAWSPPVEVPGGVVPPGESLVDFVVDLREGYDAVLAGMHKVHRKNIRRAGKNGVTVVEDCSLEALLHLREMTRTASERAAAKSEGFAIRTESYFEAVHRHVYSTDVGRLFLAEIDGRPVAALACLGTAKRAITVRSGALPEGYQSYAMYLLHDELFRRAVEDGMVEVNLGGVPEGAAEADHPQSGLHAFKRGFGGSAVVRHPLEMTL